MMEITIWGSRGSIPVSGPQFMKHGGSTTCLEIALLDAKEETPQRILIDCGTGLTELGKEWGDRAPSALILQTHMHWDHIQGFPFFRPFFDPQSSFDLWSVPREGCSFQNQLSEQMKRPAFPVGLEIFPSQLIFQDLPTKGTCQLGELTLTWIDVEHPSGSTAYRLDYRDTSFVFSGDVEVQTSPQSLHELQHLAHHADLFLMDAQYLPSEYPSCRGFGHSTLEDAVDLAMKAGVQRLLLTHHDPSHTDAQLNTKQAMAQLHAQHSALRVNNAYDRMSINLSLPEQTQACA